MNYATRISTALLVTILIGCGNKQKKDEDFFTSGSRSADQRADQRMAKTQQLRGEGAGEEGKQMKDEAQKTLYDRLGGEAGIAALVDDFLPRVLADPRVNWERKNVKRGGFSLRRSKSVEWSATNENQAKLKTHLAQFFALATGGPAKYEGRDMKEVHNGMHISNTEFDAAVGDLKATLDKLQVPNQDQKELLSIVESTRPQVAEER